MLAAIKQMRIAMSPAAFLLAATIILATPGPTNTILAASGAAMGWRRARVLPLAEAAGYLLATSCYLVLAGSLAHLAVAMAALKACAAAWLLYAAWQLWGRQMHAADADVPVSVRRVFITTLLNPKAMLVGAILIPSLEEASRLRAIAIYAGLSLAAGALWTLGGSLLPRRFRPYSYRAAAIVVGLFSVAAASSALTG